MSRGDGYSIDRKAGRWASSVRERVDFLLANPGLCEMSRRTIVDRLKELQYVAKSTYWKDVRIEQLLDLVDTARFANGQPPVHRRLQDDD